jgi:two-component system sensor histidine kinase KdpD
MFLMYFVVASINAVSTFKIRQMEKKARDKEEKEKTIKLYNTLLNSLSHELRTPISTIIGSIDTIIGNENKLSESNISELHTEIKIAGFRLNRQVENLLNMSRLESGTLKPKLDWVDLNELIFSIIRNNQEDSKEHRVYFEPKDNFPLIKSDRGLLEQIIQNIIYNALRHTPKNSSIKIEVETINEYCQIAISDNGMGFPDREMEAVFDKFYRLSGSSTGGLGLGLSIAKGFTEALNGKIMVENVKSGGARFTIKIPAETSITNDFKYE